MNSLKEKIESVGLSYKIEVIKLVSVNLILIVIFILLLVFYKSLYLLLMVIGLALIANYYAFNRYKRLAVKQKQSHIDEFVNIITFFEVFIGNGLNIYGSFLKVIDYSSPWMKYHVENFVTDIDKDKTVSPFIDFSKQFENRIVESVMVSIYQMVEDGEKAIKLTQFKFLFERFSETNQMERMEIKKRKLDSLNALPLIGAGIITAIVTFGVISIVGDLVNVL